MARPKRFELLTPRFVVCEPALTEPDKAGQHFSLNSLISLVLSHFVRHCRGQPRTWPDSVLCYPPVIPDPATRSIQTWRRSSLRGPWKAQSRLKKVAPPGPTASFPACSSSPTPAARRCFRLLARIHGKQVNLEIGDAAILSLADARAKAKGLLGAIAHGEDPRETKRAAVKTAAKTVEVVATEFIERYAKVHNKPRTSAETERLIAGNIIKTWGKRPITSIDQRDVIDLLDVVTDRGSPVAANRVLAAGRKMFNWAIERGLLKTSPFDRVKAPTKETSRDRVLADSELTLILQAADRLGPVFGAFVKILTLTGQRREEVAGMMWAELDADLTMWTIPRERTKNGIVHPVPIVPWVRSILTGLPRARGLGLRSHHNRQDLDLGLLQGQGRA